jgi:hypothetical protein
MLRTIATSLGTKRLSAVPSVAGPGRRPGCIAAGAAAPASAQRQPTVHDDPERSSA